jgi:serine/threonine-protein kinase
VFLAEQIALGNRPVALKVLLRKLLDDPGFLLRFHDEAASIARLRHPNVIAVYESGISDDGSPYIAMEYLKGETLRQALQARGAFSVQQTVEILQQAAQGLNVAHKLGIIHGDLKPDNIFLTRSEAGEPGVKITDFGIAKLRESATRTLPGTALGTSAYLSYEQASGLRSEELTARADIYSLGVVVYEMLTGRLPFQPDTPLGGARKETAEKPPPSSAIAPGLVLGSAVERAVMKALEKQREERYASVLEFARALAAAQPAARLESKESPANTNVVFPPAEMPHAPAPSPARVGEGSGAPPVPPPVLAQAHAAVQTPPPSPAKEIPQPLKPQPKVAPAAPPVISEPVVAAPPPLRSVADTAVQTPPPAPAKEIPQPLKLQPEVAPAAPPVIPQAVEAGPPRLSSVAAAAVQTPPPSPAREVPQPAKPQPEVATPTAPVIPQAVEAVPPRLSSVADAAVQTPPPTPAREILQPPKPQPEVAPAAPPVIPQPVEAVPRRWRSVVDAAIQTPPPTPAREILQPAKPQPEVAPPTPLVFSQPVEEWPPEFPSVTEPRSRGKYLVLGLLAMLIVIAAVWSLSRLGEQHQEKATGQPSEARQSLSQPASSAAPAGMVAIPGGTFMMGRDDAEDLEETPGHSVAVAPFYLDLTPVTRGEYKRVQADSSWPATDVSWNDSQAYCHSKGKRLPSEAEWEYAARGRDGRLFPWGNEFDSKATNSIEAGLGHLIGVGALPKNKSPFGVLDMSGNIWEWTADDYKPYPGHQATFEIPADGKVIRGGSYQSDRFHATTTTRNLDHASTRSPAIGFRCAKSM